MRVVVTGAAGFVGSALCDRLLDEGHDVVGLDRLSAYYSVDQKLDNLTHALRSSTFAFLEVDLLTANLRDVLADVDWVFHQAGQPGVRASWGSQFDGYVRDNVLATQKLLEAALGSGIKRFVNASSSSIYGNALHHPTSEDDPKSPVSPYGVTKYAAEQLCAAYAHSFDLPVVSLRYFTVFGPRQRPDMAINRMIAAAISETSEPFELYGDGTQVRDFTYVEDVVDANIRAALVDNVVGSVFNIAGGSAVNVNDLLEVVGRTVGRDVPVRRIPSQAGDVRRTGGAIEAAKSCLRWEPSVSLDAGIDWQVAWQMSRMRKRSDR